MQTYLTEKRHTGNDCQLFDVRLSTLCEGKMAGARAIDVWNGGNLFFTILPDRGMDLYTARFRNKNIAFHTPSGFASPQYYNDDGAKWLRSFGGGLMVTCGLQNIGSPDPANPDAPLHGRIGNTPAESLCIDRDPDGMGVTIRGTMREAILFGARLTLQRSIRCVRGEDRIHITDTVVNHGFRREPLAMLYHFNIGYPLLSEQSIVHIPSLKVEPRDEHAASDLANWRVIRAPEENFQEMCYYHTVQEEADGLRTVGIDNPTEGIGMRISFRSALLDRVVQWRMFGCGDYVMGLEPGSCTLAGASDAIANGSMKYIDPQSSVTNELTVSFTEVGA